MTVKTNKLILRDETTGYTVTNVPATTLTANRTQLLQNTDSPVAVVQNIQDASVAKPSYKFTADNSYISVGVSAINAFTNNDFTVLVVFSSDATTANLDGLMSKIVAGPSYGYSIKYGTLGWFFTDLMSGASNTTYIPGLEASNLSNYAGKPTALVIQRHDNNGTNEYHTAYLNGVKVLNAVSKNAITYPTYDTNLVGAFWSAGMTLHGSLYRFIEFNYKISEDKVRRYSSGAKLDFEDIGGSMCKLFNMGCTTFGDTNLIDSDANGVVDGWISSSGTPTINTDSNNGWSGERRQQVSLSSQRVVLTSVNSLMVSGKAYTITFDYINTTAFTISIQNGATILGTIPANVSTKTTYSLTIPSWSGMVVGTYYSQTSLQFAGDSVSATGLFQIRNLQVKQLGAVLDLEPESMTPNVWHDESGNQLDGAVTGASLVNLPHYANTDFGPAAVKQELIDSKIGPSYWDAHTGKILTTTSTKLDLAGLDSTLIVNAVCENLSPSTTKALAQVVGTNVKTAFVQTTGSPTQLTHRQGATYTPLQIYMEQNIPFCAAVKRYSESGTGKIQGFMNGISGPVINQTFDTSTGSSIFQFSDPSANGWDGSTSRCLVFNYALSETQIRRYSSGAKLDWIDIGGTANRLTNGDFSLGTPPAATGWTFSANVSNVAAQLTFSSSAVVGNYCFQNIGASTQNKKYRLYYDVKSNANTSLSNIGLTTTGLGGGYIVAASTYLNLTVGDGKYIEFTITGGAANDLFGLYVYTANLNGAIALDNLVLVQLGAVLDLEPEGIGEKTWVDSSPNKLHGDVTNALAQFPFSDDPSQDTGWLAYTDITNITGFTGAPTGIYSSKYRVSNGICTFQLEITPGTLTLPTAGTNCFFGFKLPVNARTAGEYINGIASIYTAAGKEVFVLSDYDGGTRNKGAAIGTNRFAGAITSLVLTGWYFI